MNTFNCYSQNINKSALVSTYEIPTAKIITNVVPVSSNGYYNYYFTNTAANTNFFKMTNQTGIIPISIFAVGGGGGAGFRIFSGQQQTGSGTVFYDFRGGGGGGAGGVIEKNVNIISGITLNINVGNGGLGTTNQNIGNSGLTSSSGSPTTITSSNNYITITANGGGRGADRYYTNAIGGSNGGNYNTSQYNLPSISQNNTSNIVGTSTLNSPFTETFNKFSGNTHTFGSVIGGGGGAGGKGEGSTGSTGIPNGGIGIYPTVPGIIQNVYAAGGGGAMNSIATSSGSASGIGGHNGSPGAVNTGSGGGSSFSSGGAGGSGIVIIAIPIVNVSI